MATVVNSTPLCSSVSLKHSAFIGNSVGGKFLRVKPVLHTCRFPSLEVKAVDGSNKSTKPNSIVCADCDGNVRQLGSKFLASVLAVCGPVEVELQSMHACLMIGSSYNMHAEYVQIGWTILGALSCSQCKGSGVNSTDHFNGQFKAGGLCWLCRGKREILCGNCNGAGFMGGFMSSVDG